MTQFERLRATMVDNQLRTSGVTDRAVLAQMANVPRERFVPTDRRSVAYIDDVHWFGHGNGRRFMLAPAVLAKLLQLAAIAPDESVLDVGPATGYSTAVIAGLAASVVGLESDATLAASASEAIRELGLANATIVSGDLADLDGRVFDVIFVQGSLDSIPTAMRALLKEGGRLVAALRTGSVAVAHVFVRNGNALAAHGEFNVSVPPLSHGAREPAFVL